MEAIGSEYLTTQDLIMWDAMKDSGKQKAQRLPTKGGKTNFTITETALLILYLREKKVFLPDVTDVIAIKCFEDLSGYSSKQLKKELSGLRKKINSGDSNVKANNFSKLKLLFDSLSKQIDADSK